jgi:hypothetical protein
MRSGGVFIVFACMGSPPKKVFHFQAHTIIPLACVWVVVGSISLLKLASGDGLMVYKNGLQVVAKKVYKLFCMLHRIALHIFWNIQ